MSRSSRSGPQFESLLLGYLLSLSGTTLSPAAGFSQPLSALGDPSENPICQIRGGRRNRIMIEPNVGPLQSPVCVCVEQLSVARTAQGGDRRASPSAEHSEPEGPEETEAATGLYSSCSVDSFHRSQMPSRSFGLTRSSAGIERVSEPGGAGNLAIRAVDQRSIKSCAI